ncbi:hypothetical protein AgCh_009446 [Apium graveolens]
MTAWTEYRDSAKRTGVWPGRFTRLGNEDTGRCIKKESSAMCTERRWHGGFWGGDDEVGGIGGGFGGESGRGGGFGGGGGGGGGSGVVMVEGSCGEKGRG